MTARLTEWVARPFRATVWGYRTIGPAWSIIIVVLAAIATACFARAIALTLPSQSPTPGVVGATATQVAPRGHPPTGFTPGAKLVIPSLRERDTVELVSVDSSGVVGTPEAAVGWLPLPARGALLEAHYDHAVGDGNTSPGVAARWPNLVVGDEVDLTNGGATTKYLVAQRAVVPGVGVPAEYVTRGPNSIVLSTCYGPFVPVVSEGPGLHHADRLVLVAQKVGS